MNAPTPLQFHTSPVRTGEKLRGELVLGEATYALARAARVRIRVRGQMDCDDSHCTLTLDVEGLEGMVLHNPLEIAPEVLEAES